MKPPPHPPPWTPPPHHPRRHGKPPWGTRRQRLFWRFVAWFGFMALLFTAGNVLLQPSVTALISKRAVDGQGAAMGLNNSFQALGRATGPLWAGFAFDLTATLSFWTGALVQAIALYYATQRLPALAPQPEEVPAAD